MPDKWMELILLSNNHLMIDENTESHRLTKIQKTINEKLISAGKISVYEALFQLGFLKSDLLLSPNLEFWRKFAEEFIQELRFSEALEKLRHKQSIKSYPGFFFELLLESPFFQGSEYLNLDSLKIVWDNLLTHFQSQIKKFKGTVEEFLKQYSSDVHLIDKVFFHLVESKTEAKPFAFMATYSVGLAKNNKAQHRPLNFALKEFDDKQDKLIDLLATVAKAAEKSPFVKSILDSGEIFYPLNLTPNEGYKFLKELSVYEDAGIMCRIPNWWRSKRKGASLSVFFGDKKKKSLLGLDSLVDFSAKITVGGVELTAVEARKLLEQSEGLAQIKGKWVVVDKDKLQQSLENWEKAQSLMNQEGLSLSDAMRLLMKNGDNKILDFSEEEDVSISAGKWLQDVMAKMRNPQKIKNAGVHKDFKAILRPYQQAGLNWLRLLDSLKFGACLADDMGLGKTIQILALLNSLRRKKNYTPSLLVLPASLVHNWASELKKFAPNIKYGIAHTSGGELELAKSATLDDLNKYQLILTTYGIAKRYKWIKDFDWNYIILDEAQAIKNPATAQTKAMKALKSKNRIALTGTPIENRLSDLWSLFDFLNPGLLGNKTEFKKFIKNNDDLSGLRKVVSPYILRRLKTDKSIISDLPDKIEMNTYSQLSKMQFALYQNEVDKLKEKLENAEGIARKGLVLTSLMKFKQICNHPDQFYGNNAFAEKNSGKFKRLREICETIKEKHEKVLVFTQFKEMTEPLAHFLKEVFGNEGLILHGSKSIKKRKDMIEKFQSDQYIPFFILSIKAGGTGLNLTAANHVIHFDRWWNPAVENQATDRAFRIGQKKSVVVHKFITEGTIEEKISQMIKDKKALSNEVLAGSGEASSLTEMNNEELIDMFSLGGIK
ncbi:MAG: DEAD/DEAH box helicase [Verrucomicrobiota bacterium]|nr:DEAD/DEAH box helicase [Verrucomicrobiota bacterium]